MQEYAGQGADDLKPMTLPEIHGALIGADKEVQLHGAKTASGSPRQYAISFLARKRTR